MLSLKHHNYKQRLELRFLPRDDFAAGPLHSGIYIDIISFVYRTQAAIAAPSF